jgi:hypothetical protein
MVCCSTCRLGTVKSRKLSASMEKEADFWGIWSTDQTSLIGAFHCEGKNADPSRIHSNACVKG